MMPPGEFTDTVLFCQDCRADFVWTSGEQRFFSEKGFTPPKRCKGCRDRKKLLRAQGATDPATVTAAPFYDKDQDERDNVEESRRRRHRGR